jgi:hypothetical protein
MLSIIANTRAGIKNNAATKQKTLINSFASMAGFLVQLGKILYPTVWHTSTYR